MNNIIYKYMLIKLLKLHNLCYKLVSLISIRLEGEHPKHRLIKYKDYFFDRVDNDDVVLDIGSNTGSITFHLSKKAHHCYGIEIDKAHHLIAVKKNNKKNVEFINSDATIYNYSQLMPISVIVMSNVLEHIENREQFLDDILRKISWKRNKIPKLLIRVPMIDRDWITLYKHNIGVEWRLDPTHFVEYTMDELTAELKNVNIFIEDAKVRFGEAYLSCVYRPEYLKN